MKRPMSDEDNGMEDGIDLGEAQDDDLNADIVYEDTESDLQDDSFTHMMKRGWG